MAVALAEELALALACAREAGRLVIALRDGELDVEMKAGNEPVTIADKRSSELIISRLRERFAADPIVSEEAADRTLVPERMWLVDPIDGTKDFIRKNDGFSVMIGLVVAGRPALGVVYQAAVDRMFYATPEGGAWMTVGDGAPQPLVVSAVAQAGQAKLVASASHRSDDIDRVKKTLGIDDELNIGSVGIKLSLIALGVRDLYVNPSTKTKVWDTCAPEAILTRAGGRLSDLFGDPIDYAELRQPRGLVASNGHVHDEVIGKLAPLFDHYRTKPA